MLETYLRHLKILARTQPRRATIVRPNPNPKPMMKLWPSWSSSKAISASWAAEAISSCDLTAADSSLDESAKKNPKKRHNLSLYLTQMNKGTNPDQTIHQP